MGMTKIARFDPRVPESTCLNKKHRPSDITTPVGAHRELHGDEAVLLAHV